MDDDLARRQIRAATQRTIQRAGVSGIIPTPLEAVSRAAGITETIDVSDIPRTLVARRPNVLSRVLGAILYRPRIVVVDRSQGYARGRFIEAHEIAHKIVPWHEAIFRLDDEERVFGHTKKRVDQEADVGAAELLFQGDLFMRQALDYEVSIAAPMALSSEFGVSLTAAVRHYPADHPDPVAVICGGRFRRATGLPIWAVHTSPAFRTKYGDVTRIFPGGIPTRESEDPIVGPVVDEVFKYRDIARAAIQVPDLGGKRQELVLEAFYNGIQLLILLTEKKVAGRRARRLASGAL